jgi:hypothetical protein
MMSAHIPFKALNLSDEITARTDALIGVFRELTLMAGTGERHPMHQLYGFVLGEAEAIERAHKKMFEALRAGGGEDEAT